MGWNRLKRVLSFSISTSQRLTRAFNCSSGNKLSPTATAKALYLLRTAFPAQSNPKGNCLTAELFNCTPNGCCPSKHLSCLQQLAVIRVFVTPPLHEVDRWSVVSAQQQRHGLLRQQRWPESSGRSEPNVVEIKSSDNNLGHLSKINWNVNGLCVYMCIYIKTVW